MIGQEPDERPIATPVASGEAAWREIARLRLETIELRDARIAELEAEKIEMLIAVGHAIGALEVIKISRENFRMEGVNETLGRLEKVTP